MPLTPSPTAGPTAARSDRMLKCRNCCWNVVQFDSQLLDAFADMVKRGDLKETVGNSEAGRPLVTRLTSGPVIPFTRQVRDGNLAYCRVCGMQHRLHKKADTFEVEPTGQKGPAEQLKPQPEMSALEVLVSEAPGSVRLKQPLGGGKKATSRERTCPLELCSSSTISRWTTHLRIFEPFCIAWLFLLNYLMPQLPSAHSVPVGILMGFSSFLIPLLGIHLSMDTV